MIDFHDLEGEMRVAAGADALLLAIEPMPLRAILGSSPAIAQSKPPSVHKRAMYSAVSAAASRGSSSAFTRLLKGSGVTGPS